MIVGKLTSHPYFLFYKRGRDMKTRCGNCRTLTDYGRTYCLKCEEKIKKSRKKNLSEKVEVADKFTKTATWKSLRREIIRRDNNCCVLCFVRGKIEYRQLQVHHIIKRVDNLELAYEPNNLVTVCRTCHEEVEKLSPAQQRELLRLGDSASDTTIHYLL